MKNKLIKKKVIDTIHKDMRLYRGMSEDVRVYQAFFYRVIDETIKEIKKAKKVRK